MTSNPRSRALRPLVPGGGGGGRKHINDGVSRGQFFECGSTHTAAFAPRHVEGSTAKNRCVVAVPFAVGVAPLRPGAAAIVWRAIPPPRNQSPLRPGLNPQIRLLSLLPLPSHLPLCDPVYLAGKQFPAGRRAAEVPLPRRSPCLSSPLLARAPERCCFPAPLPQLTAITATPLPSFCQGCRPPPSPKHRENNIQKYPRNSTRRMNYPEFCPKGMNLRVREETKLGRKCQKSRIEVVYCSVSHTPLWTAKTRWYDTQDKICQGSRVASAGTRVNVGRQTTLQDVTYV